MFRNLTTPFNFFLPSTNHCTPQNVNNDTYADKTTEKYLNYD